MEIRNKLIKLLGGYTSKEKERWEQKYYALLASKTNETTAQICNEYMCQLLKDIYKYMQNLYGIEGNVWANKVFNVIKNNYFRIMIRFVHSQSVILYKLDTTLDSKDEFKNVLKEDNDNDSLFILEND